MSAADQPRPTRPFAILWTGRYAIVWSAGITGWFDSTRATMVDSGRYDPAADRWLPISGQGAPVFERSTAAWTGSDLLVWGADPDGAPVGGRYDPHADTWHAMSTNLAPRAMKYLHGAWADRELLAWTNDGTAWAPADARRYDPIGDIWRPLPILPVLREGLDVATAWTGAELLVWPNRSRAGASFKPATGRWATLSTGQSPRTRVDASTVWTGRWLVVWGGMVPDHLKPANVPPNAVVDPAPDNLDHGGAYDPMNDTWHVLPMLGGRAGEFVGRANHVAVWTGTEMIVWGGENRGFRGKSRNDGARWRPA